MAALPVPTEGSGADGREEGGGGAGRGDVSVAWRESELEWRMRSCGGSVDGFAALGWARSLE